MQRLRIRRYDELVTLRLEVLGARVEGGLEYRVFMVARAIDIDLSLPLEQIRHRVRSAEVAAQPAEAVPDIGDGARGIVGQGENENRHAAGTVAFIRDLAVIDAFQIARPLLDGALDVLLRH